MCLQTTYQGQPERSERQARNRTVLLQNTKEELEPIVLVATFISSSELEESLVIIKNVSLSGNGTRTFVRL